MPDNNRVKKIYKYVYNKYRAHKDDQLYGIKLENSF